MRELFSLLIECNSNVNIALIFLCVCVAKLIVAFIQHENLIFAIFRFNIYKLDRVFMWQLTQPYKPENVFL